MSSVHEINVVLSKVEDDYDVLVPFASHVSGEGYGYPCVNKPKEVFFIYRYSLERYVSISNPGFPLEIEIKTPEVFYRGLELKESLLRVLESDFGFYRDVRSSRFYRNDFDFSGSVLTLYFHILDRIKFLNSGISLLRGQGLSISQNSVIDLYDYIHNLQIALMIWNLAHTDSIPGGDIVRVAQQKPGSKAYMPRLLSFVRELSHSGSRLVKLQQEDVNFFKSLMVNSQGISHRHIRREEAEDAINSFFLDIIR